MLQKPWNRWIIVLAGLVVLGLISPTVVNNRLAKSIRFTMRPDRETDQSSGLLAVFRELQFSLADMCFNKSTLYMHSGVRYAVVYEDAVSERIQNETEGDQTPDASKEPAGQDGHGHESEAEHDQEHEDIVPWIPPKDQDFRGILGDVEREVKPTTTEHAHHSKEEEALPWLRLATIINPQHEKAWMGAAATLVEKKGDAGTSDAIALLELAVQINPLQEGKAYSMYGLQWQLAHYYYMKTSRQDRAIETLERAVERGEKDFGRLDDVQQDWLSFCVRDLIQFYRKAGRLDDAIETCRRGMVLYPEDGVIQRALRRILRQRDAANAAPGNP